MTATQRGIGDKREIVGDWGYGSVDEVLRWPWVAMRTERARTRGVCLCTNEQLVHSTAVVKGIKAWGAERENEPERLRYLPPRLPRIATTSACLLHGERIVFMFVGPGSRTRRV